MANPMYRQIAEDLREQIESGGLAPGQQLLTEIELRERFGASRNTVRDAIKWLTSLGLVETRAGQGTFVVKKILPYISTLTADPKGPGDDTPVVPRGDRYGEVDESEEEAKQRVFFSTDPQVEIQKASFSIATQLGLVEGSQVVSRHQRRSIDGTPWSLQTSFYPMGYILQGATRLIEAGDIEIGTVKYLADTLGLRQAGYRDWISVRAPDPTEASFFSLPQDGRVGVFEIYRIAYDQTGAPMRLTVTVYPTDRNQFIVNVGDVPTLQPLAIET
jgi:GntR family transcriptional regulator